MNGPRAARAGRLLCLAGAALGAIGLAGWITGATALTTFVPGQPPMMPNTALALVLAGAAAALRGCSVSPWRWLGLPATMIVLAIGIGTIAEYAWRVDLGIDRLLIWTDVGPYPGRPSPPTALAFILLAAALLLFDTRRGARMRPPEWLALGAGFIGFIALLGHLFGAGVLYMLPDAPVVGVALPTAASMLATSAGLLLARPDAGIMRVATSRGPGGILLRRLGLAIVLAPALFGFVVTRLFALLGVEDVPLVLATLSAAITVVGLLLLAVTAVSLDRTHEALEANRARTRALVEQASDGVFVADLDGRYTGVNTVGCRMLGYSREELVGRSITDLIRPEDTERFRRHREQLLAGTSEVSEWLLRRKDGTHLPVEVSARILPDGRWQGLVRDISERLRTQEQLRQSQERLELALRGADLAAWDWNIQTGEVVFNPRWATMRGFRPEEIRPHVDSWLAGIHPDDLPRVQLALREYFDGRVPEYETEHRVRTRSGQWIWILDRGRVFARDEHGRPVRMVGTELDITERKRLEQDLRRSEAKASGILSISADAIISIDAAQRITLFNEGAETIFGYTSAEALGASLDLLIPERFRSGHRRLVEQFAEGHSVARRMGERRQGICGRRKNGEEFPADAAISKLEVDGKRVLTVALRDITEEKRIEMEQTLLAEVGAALASSLEYEDTLRDVARLVVRDFAELCMIDVTDESGAIRRMSVECRDASMAPVRDLLVRLPPELTGSHPISSALESRRPVLVQRMSAVTLVSSAPRDDGLGMLRALGPQSAIAAPLLTHQTVLGIITLVSSASSRVYGSADVHLVEEVAERTALSIDNARLYRAARNAIQARDDVLGIVAHDLRNPLTAILMQAALLQRHVTESDRAKNAAATIERAASRMKRLIQDLLDVTRMEAGHVSIEHDRVSVGKVVADAVDAQRTLADSASVELRVDVAPDLADVWADRDRLLQVFENLIGNAIRCTKAGGRITVGAAPRDGAVMVWVADTGRGIAPDDVPHLFDRFWQAHKAEHHGAGLGLAIVKGIVDAHGGRVWVESTPGRGSTFFFTLPITPTAVLTA